MDEIKEAIKETLRVSVLAVIPVAIDGLTAGQLNVNLITGTFIIALLRGIDKWLHEVGKSNDNNLMIKGLTRF